MSQSVSSPHALTPYPQGSLREIIAICIPLMLGLLSASLMGFCDRVFLAHYDLQAMEASVCANNLCMLFQVPLLRLVAMVQVFVGLFYGARRFDRIGPSVWQMIWLSVFSMLFTYPVGEFVAPFFFEGTPIQPLATTYFRTLMAVNFLFPLGTTLSCYFMGLGRIRTIMLTSLFSHGLNIGLDYVFIFGIPGIFPSLGIWGAALATGISQLMFCVILFLVFINRSDRKTYLTDKYRFRWEIFWGQMRVGLPRAIARVILLTAWVSISRLMAQKGGDYLMVLSVGGSLILLFTFVFDGMIQGLISIASHLMGAKEYEKIWKMVRSGLVFILLIGAGLAFPYLIFQDLTLSFFFPTPPSAQTVLILKKTCVWLWFFFVCNGINAIGQSLVTASRDLTFLMCSVSFVWLTSYAPIYLGMNVLHFTADKFWLLLSFDALFFGGLFILRGTREKWKNHDENFELG